MTKKFFIISVILVVLLFSGLTVKAIKPSTDSAEVLACVKTAVEKREAAIQTAFDNFSVTIKSTLQTRKSELSAAWDIADRNERMKAVRNAWAKFKEAKRTAAKTFNQARLAAWKQFTIDRKACKALPTGEIPGADLSF